jgi:uncharacterized spore protein YtfJ
MDIRDPIKTTVEEISKILNIENVVGNPIETDEMLLFPIAKMGMGFGTGIGKKGLKTRIDLAPEQVKLQVLNQWL